MDYIKSNDSNLYGVISDVIKDSLSGKKLNISNSFFSHNTNYKNGISILKNGILSANEKEKRSVFKNVYQYPDNVNGRDFISVSKDEDIPETGFKLTYTVDHPLDLNFIIDEQKIKQITRVMRNCHNYTNEHLVENYIPTDTFICLETRLLKFIKMLNENVRNLNKDQLIFCYNELINIIKFLETQEQELCITESSDVSKEKRIINQKQFLSVAPTIIK